MGSGRPPVKHKTWVEFTLDGHYTVCECGFQGPIGLRNHATRLAVKHAREGNASG